MQAVLGRCKDKKLKYYMQIIKQLFSVFYKKMFEEYFKRVKCEIIGVREVRG